MKVFISWSGETSRAVARALWNWLPSVIQALDPWMSDENLQKGGRWSTDLAGRLEKTDFGICCLTPDNLQAPWLHFEAGALAKRVTAAYVCPYLFRVDPADVQGPLREFTPTSANREDTWKLIQTVNAVLPENRLSDKRRDDAFELCWPKLEKEESVSLLVVEATPITLLRPAGYTITAWPSLPTDATPTAPALVA